MFIASKHNKLVLLDINYSVQGLNFKFVFHSDRQVVSVLFHLTRSQNICRQNAVKRFFHPLQTPAN